ncbi:MAG: hydroxylamine reductase [Pseudomonadota bacterium]
MFCYQCEQTAQGTGCTVQGVCGKSPDVSAMIDLTMYAVKSLAQHAHRLRQLGISDPEINQLTIEALFSTVTNVNFDPKRYQILLEKVFAAKTKAKKLYQETCQQKGIKPEQISGSAQIEFTPELQASLTEGRKHPITERKQKLGDDITGLQELLTYGLKGTAAYADHAFILGQEEENIYAFFHKALSFLADEPTDAAKLMELINECGKVNLRVMELLDKANTSSYGHPIPTKVRITPVQGKAILVSGHDLKDLEEILKQTKDKDINIYTHGEMLPTHAYPELKKYKHLVGNYGGAWQDQQKEFAQFPGPIVMTTNCIQRPMDSYKNRIFTCGLVAWPEVKHISNYEFGSVIEAALASPGFTTNEQEKYITVGFGHNATLGVADKVIEAVKSKAIRHFFLIGGCDGAKSGRNYYTEFAEKVPKDCIILTLACGKYRFNKLNFGDIGGIPRLLDCGQCNDAYSAIKIASALADTFKCSVNELPLSLILSWYEQKAVCILLTLLHLGIKNMRLGPSLPAFVTPNILKVLVEKYNIMPIKTAEKDLAEILS